MFTQQFPKSIENTHTHTPKPNQAKRRATILLLRIMRSVARVRLVEFDNVDADDDDDDDDVEQKPKRVDANKCAYCTPRARPPERGCDAAIRMSCKHDCCCSSMPGGSVIPVRACVSSVLGICLGPLRAQEQCDNPALWQRVCRTVRVIVIVPLPPATAPRDHAVAEI